DVAAAVTAAAAAAAAPHSPDMPAGSAPQVRGPAATSLNSQADVLHFLLRMVYKPRPQSAPGCARSPQPDNTTTGPSVTPSIPPSPPVASFNGGTHQFMSSSPPPSSSPSSRWTFDNCIRETLASVAALLLIGSGYVGAATRLLAAVPLASHLQRASLLDRMWALIGANSTWIRYLPCHAEIQDAAGKQVSLGGPEVELEMALGSRVNFLESQRFWLLGDEEEDLGEMEEDDGDEEMEEMEEDEDAEGAANEQVAGWGDGEEGEPDAEDQGSGDFDWNGAEEQPAAAAAAMDFEGEDEEDAQAALAALANAAIGSNGGGDGVGGVDMGGGQAMAMAVEAGIGNPDVPGVVGEAMAADVQLQQGQQIEGWNLDQLLQPPQVPPPQLPPEHGAEGPAAPPALQPPPQQQQQEQQQEAAAGAAGIAPAPAPAAVPMPPEFPRAPFVSEQEEQLVRQLSRGVQYLWSASTYSGTSDVSPSQFPSGNLCIRGPHPCRGFRSQPELVRHAEAVIEAVCLSCSKEVAAKGSQLPSLALRAGGAAAPPGSSEVWQTSLAALMAACASVAEVQRRAMAMVMAMPDVRARLAAAVAVAAELVQQGRTSLAAELILTAYGTPPHRCGGNGAEAADAMDVDGSGGSGGGGGDASSFAASSADPTESTATPLDSLDFKMTLSGQSALVWACAHLDRVVHLATGRARVCAVASVLSSQVASKCSAHAGPTTVVGACSHASSGPFFLNASAAFPAEEARALVPLMRSLPVTFLERCLTEVPLMLQPTDVARQLLLTSLGRPDPAMGREDMARALHQLMYFSKLSVGTRVGLRSAVDMSPLERELTGVSLLLTSLIRFIETPTPRALAVTGAGLRLGMELGVAGGVGAHQGEEEADGAAANVLAGWLGQQQPQHPEQEMEQEDAEEAIAIEGLHEQVGGQAAAAAVAAGINLQAAHLAAALGPEAGHEGCPGLVLEAGSGGAQGVDDMAEWEDMGESEEEESDGEGHSGRETGAEVKRGRGGSDPGDSSCGVDSVCSVGGKGGDADDTIMEDRQAAEPGPEGMAGGTEGAAPLSVVPLIHLDSQGVRRLRLAPSVLRELVSEAQMWGIMPRLRCGSLPGGSADAAEAATAPTACGGGGGLTDAPTGTTGSTDTAPGRGSSACVSWRRWPPELIACRRLPRLLADALRPEDAGVLGPLLARTTGALLSWDLPYAVVLAVHAARDLGPEALGESGADVAVSSLERLCQACSRYRFVRGMLRRHSSSELQPQAGGAELAGDVPTAAASTAIAGRGRRRRWQETAVPRRTTGSRGICSAGGGVPLQGWQLPPPRTSWCLAAELLVHCFAPYWRQRLSAAVLGMSAMVVGLPARDRVGPMAQLFLLAAVGAASPVPASAPEGQQRKQSAVALRLQQKLQEQQKQYQAEARGKDKDPSAPPPAESVVNLGAAGLLPASADPSFTTVSTGSSEGRREASAEGGPKGGDAAGRPETREVDAKEASRSAPCVGERDSLLHMLYDVAHPWQRLLYDLATAVWGDKLQLPPAAALGAPECPMDAAPTAGTSGTTAVAAATVGPMPLLLPQQPPSSPGDRPSSHAAMAGISVAEDTVPVPAASRQLLYSGAGVCEPRS
ncbi:hypothetical protein Vafri_4142, partial [Volvox africanus]